MTTLAIRNGHLIDPAAGIDAPKDIFIQNGRVAEIAAPGKLKLANGAPVIDAKGLTVAPGLIDIHARARPGIQRDHRHRHRRRSSWRIYRRCRHAQHHAGKRFG